jgi:hypothetical protein
MIRGCAASARRRALSADASDIKEILSFEGFKILQSNRTHRQGRASLNTQFLWTIHATN